MDELTSSFPQLSLGSQNGPLQAMPAKPAKKSRKKPKNKKKQQPISGNAPSFYVFTEYHNLVVERVGVELNMRTTLGKNPIEDYDTYVTGKFECQIPDCNNKFWTSGMIAITIQMYSSTDYSTRVYGQSCRACKQLGHLQVDVSVYVERVSYRLRKWLRLGSTDETPFFQEKSTPPHVVELCEGCKAGVCQGK